MPSLVLRLVINGFEIVSYFDHPYASNSNIKEISDRYYGRQKPGNIDTIFDFGSAFHAGILEPHKADLTNVSEEDQELIKEMAATFWRDEMCRNIAMVSDFRREHEFYRKDRFGLVGAKCKCDGESKKLRLILELKGLSVSSEKQFRESIEHLSYDQGAAWYLNVTDSSGVVIRPNYEHKLIVGISKKQPDLMFKLLINRDHVLYKIGMVKVIGGVKIWKQFGFQ